LSGGFGGVFALSRLPSIAMLRMQGSVDQNQSAAGEPSSPRRFEAHAIRLVRTARHQEVMADDDFADQAIGP